MRVPQSFVRASVRVVRALGVLVLPVAVTVQPAVAQDRTTEAVLEWNRVLAEALAVQGALPSTTFFPRPLAMVHIAIFDAVNSIEYRYMPYYVRVRAEPGASTEAAVAQAAHDVLRSLMPSEAMRFHAQLAADLAALPPGPAAAGAAVGAAVAREIIELRRNDGWSRMPPPYMLPNLPGYWQPTPPNNQAATLTHYPDVVAFALDGSRHFVPAPPPALTSQTYTDDFNQVKSLGALNSTTRTPEQTLIARNIAGTNTVTGPSRVWNQVARDLARSRGMTGLETARLFALLNMALHDGLRTTFNGKFLYGLWRPVTAIREAARDGNPDTEADPNWLPLIPTPPYPSYPGNMSCIGAASARVMAMVLGRDDIPFSVTWSETEGPGWTRSYNGFRQFADEQADARIWSGIHFEFDHLASKGVCTQVAEYVCENQLRPLF